MKNYDDVVDQLLNYGLRPVMPLAIGNIVRTKVDGHRGTKGWYVLHSMPVSGGDLLVGSYGIWHGMDDNRQKIFIKIGDELSSEQKKAFAKRMADDRKRNEAFKKKRADTAARKAKSGWGGFSEDGEHECLPRKHIKSFGLRYTDKGALAIPMQDTTGKIHGLQLILDRVKHKEQLKNNGRDKLYWPPGVNKKGHFYLIGSPVNILLIAEGYATAASLHMATGLPVAVAFDANNLMPVTEALKKRYKNIEIIVCADDDAFSKCIECNEPVNVNQSVDCPHCNKPHKKKNTGVEAASMVAMTLSCHWVKPEFDDLAANYERFCNGKGKLSDFNDKHVNDGLHTVRVQMDNAIDQFKLRGKLSGGARPEQGEGDDNSAVKPICSSEEINSRFVLVYGEGGIAYDQKYRIFVKLKDISDACTTREIFRDWSESSERKVCLFHEVGWDPGSKGLYKYNTHGELSSVPIKGDCGLLLELLRYMCGPGEDGQLMNAFILNWLSYPLQNLGAKMKSCIVVHGPQGTGKNLFFDAIMAIYGDYGGIIDQPTLEDKFTDWASKKLFIVADEVVARSDLYHVKNKMKGLITGESIRINPKTKISFVEKNHMNIVILSNEHMPVVLEEDDRRHAVTWTPEKLSPDFYKDVAAEINNGGIAALHNYLLERPLGDFNEHTKPPLTEAKKALIEQGLKPTSRFYKALVDSEIFAKTEQKIWPMSHDQIYEAFCLWCAKVGIKKTAQHVLIADIKSKKGVGNVREWCYVKNNMSDKVRVRFLELPKCQELPVGSTKIIFYTDCMKNTDDMLDFMRMEW